MKKHRSPYLIPCFIVCVTLALSSCNEKVPSPPPSDPTVENANTGAQFSLGMSRDDVEKQLPSSSIIYEGESPSWTAVIYGETAEQQISFRYQNEQVVEISVGEGTPDVQETSSWQIGTLSLGSKKEEVLAAYGTPSSTHTTEEGVVALIYDGFSFLLAKDAVFSFSVARPVAARPSSQDTAP